MCRADPFTKKDWYDIKAPSVFQVKNVGKTLVTRTQGTKVNQFCLSFYENLLALYCGSLVLIFRMGILVCYSFTTFVRHIQMYASVLPLIG